jgi:hypothetical protein
MVMADIIEIGDTPDDSPLKTGDTRRKYNILCPTGFKKNKNGKCVKIKGGK